MKLKASAWVCTECGAQVHKWSGQCVHCQGWNTLEEMADRENGRFESKVQASAGPQLLSEVTLDLEPRMETGILSVDRLLGGGIVPGSLTLLGGEPGIGKSTLLLMLSAAFCRTQRKVLYICAEESVAQVALRARRLNAQEKNLFVLSETDFSRIKEHVLQQKPDLVIVDSIQVIYKEGLTSSPGSVAQVRELAAEFMHLAKGQGISHILVGHVTKGGEIAGPKVLEHLVDTVVYFESETKNQYRLLRVVKNRFGPSDELAVFLMEKEGLAPVDNPSQLFVQEPLEEKTSGSVICPVLDGSRPFLVEVQALATKTVFATPMRKSSGFDQNRLLLLLAVMEKRAGMRLYQSDIFVSLAGGLRLSEPALDLSVVLAVASSFLNKPLPAACAAMGEVGLSGQLRAIGRPEVRLKEMEQLGLKQCIVPAVLKKNLEKIETGLELVYVATIQQAIRSVF